MILRQTAALFLDAYRELNARKLFWFVLVISGLVVIAFAAVTLDPEKGLMILHWEIGIPELARIYTPADFHKMLFVSLGIKFWLTWLAAILALVSTAGIFPDLISGGSIDMLLSKPIGRWRLFFTKYLTGLLFVALQVTVFCAGSFVVIGWRGGEWEPALFLAVPVVVLFFSYLFAICVLVGILTRSTIAALLLTLLIWALIFAVHATETTLLTFKLINQEQMKMEVREVERLERRVVALRSEIQDALAVNDELTAERKQSALDGVDRDMDRVRERMEDVEGTVNTLSSVHRGFFIAKTVLPKTSETTELLNRWLVEHAQLETDDDFYNAGNQRRRNVAEQRAAEAVAEEIERRSVRWIIGTSVGFELVILLLAGWIFVRRDY